MAEGKHLIGVDIGSSSIKIVELKSSRKGLEIVRAAYAPLPEQTIIDGHIMNRGAVVETLQQLWTQHKFTRKDVAVALYGQSVIVRKITVPTMTDAELEQQIDWEAKQHIPFDVKGMSIDYEVLRKRPEAGQMDLLLVAAKKDEVSDFTTLLKEAKVKPIIVDTHAFALQNVFESQKGLPQSGSIALINVGASVTSINIVSDGVSAFSREITNAGNSITEEIQKQANIPFEQAEAYKCGAGGGIIPQEIQLMIENACDGLAGEIQRSLDFYLATSGDQEITTVYMCGGSAYLAPLCRAVERRARVAVEVFDPTAHLIVDAKLVDGELLKKRGAQFPGAVGLALRSEREKRELLGTSHPVHINLIPQKKSAVATASTASGMQGQGWLAVVLGLLVLEVIAMFFVYNSRQKELDKTKRANAEVTASIDAIKASVAKHGEIKARLQELKDRETAIEKLQSARTGPTLAMLELSKIMSVGRGPTVDPVRLETVKRDNPTAAPSATWDPHRIWLTQYAESDRAVKISGHARDGEDVSELTRRLELSTMFSDITLLPAAKSVDSVTKLEVLGFQISAKARY